MSEPRYREIAADLRQAIQRGDYGIGDHLPRIAELVEAHGVAPMTIRNALAVLRDDGIIQTRHGVRAEVIAIPDMTPARTVEQRLADIEARLDTIESKLQ